MRIRLLLTGLNPAAVGGPAHSGDNLLRSLEKPAMLSAHVSPSRKNERNKLLNIPLPVLLELSRYWVYFPLGLPTEALCRDLCTILGEPSSVAARVIAYQRQVSAGLGAPHTPPAIRAAKCEINRATVAPIQSLSKLLELHVVKQNMDRLRISPHPDIYVDRNPESVRRIFRNDAGELLGFLMDRDLASRRLRVIIGDVWTMFIPWGGRKRAAWADALVAALHGGALSIVDALLHRGLDSERTDVLFGAACGRNVEIFKALMEYGRLQFTVDELSVAMLIAINNTYSNGEADTTELIQFLLGKGAKINYVPPQPDPLLPPVQHL
ncbi:hypothetical protein M427DRAFT_334019 [Gonapodya prolifera JEL478]|uniref:Ankyrin n=1 Tax=Gonapodya prolifera (strain JEL478) TaxID=1344416 RepID=A0A139AE53_GONPJ|nr:hypothetical protein M427DRAFT_334019 [Gonapodya prolifera JEL478]|eukprot:KXS15040.1 hypothetical protein M427DRAFT_334019 [Gonapodya prolifera JEL478]